MTAYANVSDVQIFNQQRTYDNKSNPTVSQVKTLIRWVTAEVNGYLCNAGYLVPVTGEISLVILRKLVALGAAAMAEEAAFMSTDQNESKHSTVLHKRFREMLKDILMGKIKLEDAEYDPSGGIVTRYMKNSREGKKFIFSQEALENFTDAHKRLSWTEFRDWLVHDEEDYLAIKAWEGCLGVGSSRGFV